MYINSSVCISYQDSFLTTGLHQRLTAAEHGSGLQHPDYKEYVSPAQLRRMSNVLKMGVAGGMEALRQAGDAPADAIIVGTGLGCIQDTLKFVGAMYQSGEGTQSPTAFIQSTHNSIAGQLALLLANHNYNMTHTQGNLSLACALLDAQLLLAEGDAAQLLVGAVDEMTDDERSMIAALADKMGVKLPVLGEGSAFFHISAQPTDHTFARITAIKMSHHGQAEAILSLLSGAEMVLSNLENPLGDQAHIRYTDHCGEYFTAPGFGLHLALEFLRSDAAFQNVLVHHRFGPQEQGILVERYRP
jgi:3-oxoacyl-[acyl-carrier-protein] synthase II